jgi:hypothetical protein
MVFVKVEFEKLSASSTPDDEPTEKVMTLANAEGADTNEAERITARRREKLGVIFAPEQELMISPADTTSYTESIGGCD